MASAQIVPENPSFRTNMTHKMWLSLLCSSKMLLMKDCEMPLNKPDRLRYLFVQRKSALQFPYMHGGLQVYISHPHDSHLSTKQEAVS